MVGKIQVTQQTYSSLDVMVKISLSLLLMVVLILIIQIVLFKMTRIPGRKVSLTTNLSMKSYNPGPKQWSLVEQGLSPVFLILNLFCSS